MLNVWFAVKIGKVRFCSLYGMSTAPALVWPATSQQNGNVVGEGNCRWQVTHMCDMALVVRTVSIAAVVAKKILSDAEGLASMLYCTLVHRIQYSNVLLSVNSTM